METLCGFGMCLCDWNMIPALNQLPCLLFLFVFFLLPFLVLTLWSVPSHRTVQTDKGRNCLLALSTGCSAIRMATIIIICKLSWSPKASGTTVKVMSDLKKKKNLLGSVINSSIVKVSYQMLAQVSWWMNTSISWIIFWNSVLKIPKLLCECLLLNFFSDPFHLVKFCCSDLHLHAKHFRSLEERKKQHQEGLYLSDTLPRKKTTPSISPHFSSATMGRSTTPKVGHGENHGLHLQWVFLSLCWLTCKGLMENAT